MTKRQQERELSELSSRIQQFQQDNQVVIERYNRMGISLLDLYNEQENLFRQYNKRWGYLSRKKNLVVSQKY
jgi:hypothetical protein